MLVWKQMLCSVLRMSPCFTRETLPSWGPRSTCFPLSPSTWHHTELLSLKLLYRDSTMVSKVTERCLPGLYRWLWQQWWVLSVNTSRFPITNGQQHGDFHYWGYFSLMTIGMNPKGHVGQNENTVLRWPSPVLRLS